MVYPIKSSRALSLVIFPIVMTASIVGYLYWGDYSSWSHYVKAQQKNQLAQEMLKQFKSPEEIIDKLKEKLDESPQSAKGWYLLGKLYLNQQDVKNATIALAKAHHLQPDDEQYAVYYAYRLWENNQRVFDTQIRSIFKKLLSKNPKQPDALAMLAMDAYTSQNYQEAIGHWRKLLSLAPDNSDEARSIRQAIARAEEKIKSP
jgi:cytochrome c-type biogenesis protein CcmH